ncbi:FUSC family protein [Virgibacillus soli]
MKLSIIRDAFKIKQSPFPLRKAFGAALSSSIPVMIGILLGNFQYGLLAGIGGFAYLYVFNEPYKHRAKKLFFVLLGLTLAMGLGSLTAGYPLVFGVLLGLIGGLATFTFGAFKIQGPAAIFFVIIFAMTSAMEVSPHDALLRASLVFSGGVISWIVAMIGWFSDPYKPEKESIYYLYGQLTNLTKSIGTEKFIEIKENTLFSLKNADATLTSGYISWRSKQYFKRLYVLKNIAHEIWMDILELEAKGVRGLSSETVYFLEQVTQSLHNKGQGKMIPTPMIEDVGSIEGSLLNKVAEANRVLHATNPNLDMEVQIQKQPFTRTFIDAFDKNSVVLLSAIRYTIVLSIAALIAFSYEFDRSYWIPVTCGSVMLGSTIISTFHRSIQRSLGTLVGVLLAVSILLIAPSPIVVAFLIGILFFLTEIFIVRNYAFAVTFITPNAILAAESTTQIGDISYFATARVTDVLIGCVIGVIGVLLVGRHSASSRLPHLMSKTIRSQSQLFFSLFADNSNSSQNTQRISRIQNKMRTNLSNLRTVYDTALGEIPHNMDRLSHISPVLFSMEQLGYFLQSNVNREGRTLLTKDETAQFLYIFETMAQSIEQNKLLGAAQVPHMPHNQRIYAEIQTLQESLKLLL